MDHLFYFFAAVVVIAGALAGIAIWAPRPLAPKVSSLVLAALLMATGYGSLVDLLGKPKPATMEWAMRAVPEATVLGASLEEGEAIYLWLQFTATAPPRAYVLPWRLQTAIQLQQAMRLAEANGTTVRMARPFDSSPDRNEPLFYPAPRPALPPKTPVAG